jgi:hypothetical protein
MRFRVPPASRLFIEDSFHKDARKLRAHLEQVMGNPRGTDPRRFCWDYWHVPGQYRLLRTPAYHFFPKSLYDPLHQKLARWGREVLGCHDISPPWMSAYIDGCEQNFHADLPHGPWAFVYSLSPVKKGARGARPYRGGETLLLREEVLSFWEQQGYGAGSGLEEAEVLEKIEAFENRLVVFDPRIPHGVSRVEGALDPLHGRIVIHGWFVQPRPFIQGSLTEKELSREIERVLASLDHLLGGPDYAGVPIAGMVSLRFKVSTGGRVAGIRVLAHSLRASAVAPELPIQVIQLLGKELSRAQFTGRATGSIVTLPFTFG